MGITITTNNKVNKAANELYITDATGSKKKVCAVYITNDIGDIKVAYQDWLTSYNTTTASYTITGRAQTKETAWVIPNTYNDGIHGTRPVTAIANDAFKGNKTLKTLTIPNSITSVGSNILAGCSNLEELTTSVIGDGQNTQTDSNVFGYLFGSDEQAWQTGGTKITQRYLWRHKVFGNWYVDERTIDYYLPTRLKTVTFTGSTIVYGAFDGCTTLQTLALTPSTAITLPKYTVSLCSSLANLSLGTKITGIAYRGINQCNNMPSLALPSSVTNLQGGSIYDCTSLTSLSIERNTTFDSANNYIFNINDKELVQGCKGVTTISVANVTKIGSYAFEGCSGLSALPIPDGITAIYKSAFEASDITSVTLPTTLVILDEDAFANCEKLTKVIWTNVNNLTEIGAGAFNHDTALATLTNFSSITGLKRINDYAFNGCSFISVLPDSLEYLSKYSLNGSPFTEYSINDVKYYKMKSTNYGVLKEYNKTNTTFTINTNCKIIYAGAFENDKVKNNLTQINLNNVVQVGESAFYNLSSVLTTVTLNSNKLKYLCDFCFAFNTSLSSFPFASTAVKEIGGSAFFSAALTSLSFPSTLEKIGTWAFNGCINATTIYFAGTGLKSIGQAAFANCAATSISIPSSVNYIGYRAFCDDAADRGRLATVTVNATTPPEIGSYDGTIGQIFWQQPLGAIYVPANRVLAYREASGWSQYAAKIQAIPSSSSGGGSGGGISYVV